jgi:branched-chain amino acid transport system permease protein
MRLQGIGLVLLVVAAIVLPWVFTDPTITNIACFSVIFAVSATSWNIFSGYTGYTALGHVAFFGTGAYALALMCQDWNIPGGYIPFLLLPLCGLIAAVVSLLFGAIALRARSHAFVVITIAIFFIFQLLAYDLRGLTYGSIGISLPIPPWTGNSYYPPFYYVGLSILLIAVATSWWIRNSKYGLGLLAIRDDEDRARGLGVKTGPSKLTAFVISAFFVGMAGGLWAYFIGSVAPASAFNTIYNVAFALMTFLGGAGILAGPILGALILEPTQLYLTILVQQQQYPALAQLQGGLNLVVYGALLLVVLLLLPEGIIPTARKRWTAWTARRGVSGPASPGVAAVGTGAGAPLMTGGGSELPTGGEGSAP